MTNADRRLRLTMSEVPQAMPSVNIQYDVDLAMQPPAAVLVIECTNLGRTPHILVGLLDDIVAAIMPSLDTMADFEQDAAGEVGPVTREAAKHIPFNPQPRGPISPRDL